MKSIELLEVMKERVPFYPARRLLSSTGYPKGNGWGAVIEKEKALGPKSKGNTVALEAGYRQTIRASEKLVRLYDVSPRELAAINSAIGGVCLDGGTDAAKRYPLLMTKAQQQGQQFQKPQAIAIENTLWGKAVIFSAVQSVKIKETISPSSLNQSLAGRYQAVYGDILLTTQYFHVVLIPHAGGRVAVLSDNPLGLHAMDRLAAQASTRIAFNSLVGFNALETPTNLFPAVAGFYGHTNGRVVELSTMSNGALESRQRMHGQICLRMDPGIAAAVAAGVTFAPFGVAVEWTVKDASGEEATPHVKVAGSAKLASDAVPVIEDASIRRCITDEELAFVLNKLEAAL